MEEKKINIIIPFYNCKDYLQDCINSVLSQKYENYKSIVIDDASTDGSWDVLPHENEKFTCIKNEKNLTALPNIYNAVINYCEPESITILLDGDDKLLNKNVLKTINEIYTNGVGGLNEIIIEDNELKKTNKVLMSYGKCIWSDGRKCFASPYSKEEFSNIKKAPFRVSHLRSFQTSVFFEIINQDPELKCFKDDNGEFYRSGYDTAIWIPLLQICSYEHTFFNSKPLYYYNIHPNNDHNVNQQLQWDVHKAALNKSNFKKIKF